MRLPQKIIDANVILRFFLADEPKQFQKAKSFFERIELGEEEVLLTEIIFVEVIWVLHKVYEIPRQDISEKISKFIYFKGLKTILEKELFIESLKHYVLSSIDIQDIFLAVLAKRKNGIVITFDKSDFKKLEVNFSEP
jgi:predicted nucleic acid-binding protein